MIHDLIAFAAPGPWGLSPVIVQTGDLHIGSFHIGHLALRWYSMAYLVGIILGFLYLLKLLDQPGAPMAKRHAEDMVVYATLGIIIGGRLAYVIFYGHELLDHPADVFKVWNGGMSFHGGVIGVSLGIFYLAWRNNLSALRIHDYVACCIPPGLFLGRLANFIKGELWGREADASVPWRMIFPDDPSHLFRHPSQLYEAALEGLLLFAILAVMVRMGALKRPGLILGSFIAIYGLARITGEFFREPDPQLGFLWGGLTMGMLLSVPMIIVGAILIMMAWRRETPEHIQKSI